MTTDLNEQWITFLERQIAPVIDGTEPPNPNGAAVAAMYVKALKRRYEDDEIPVG